MEMKLQSAMLFVKDFPRMRAFYTNLFQMEPAAGASNDRYAEFQMSGAGVALHAVAVDWAEQIEIGNPPCIREDTPVKLVFAVEDLNAERSRLTSMGVLLRETPGGQTADSFNGVDPEGNIFQLVAAHR